MPFDRAPHRTRPDDGVRVPRGSAAPGAGTGGHLSTVLRRSLVALGVGAGLAVPGALPAAPPATAATTAACRTALSASLSSTDPVALQDRAVASVHVRRGIATGVRVVVTRGGRTLASGTAQRLVRGTTAVALRLRGTPAAGAVRVRVTGTVEGCGRRAASSSVRLRSGSLPVRAALRGTTDEGGRTVVRILLRPVGGSSARDVRVRLQTPAGRTVASTGVKGRLLNATEVALRAPRGLMSGTYRVAVTGRSGAARTTGSTVQDVRISAATRIDPVAASADPPRQRVAVAWSGASSAGRDVAGFVVPGIGYGELVCSQTTQWIRVFPSDGSREQSMLTWTYRSWDGNSQNAEKALREALHTRFTGPDFNEGFNKFQPAEKQSTGEFTALLSDRGPIGAPFAPSLVPPVGIPVTWDWDFRDPSNARCNAQAQVVAQTAGSTGVGSAQVLWRGDAAAAGRDQTVVDLPGVGRTQIVCQATPAGVRTVRVDVAGASTLTTREGSVDTAVPFNGPVVASLPNNGQLQLDTATGARVLIASRWKVNDPDPAQNSCAVAAQSVLP